MKVIKVNKGNIPTICEHLRKQVLAAGNISFAQKYGVMSTKQIKAAMMPGSHFSKRIADARGWIEVRILQSIFGNDDQISISKAFGPNHISATIIPGDYLRINCFGIAIIRKNYCVFVGFVKA